ncbi:MAG: hypothetical protein EPO68_00070 [Planctomycetota bacterium]|nr:MAG: hypothetical protein EPO68_00070 [Planctomycetota bacterium]
MSERPAWRSLRMIALVAALLVAVIWYLRPLRTASDVDARASSGERAPIADAALTPGEPPAPIAAEPSERAPVPDPERSDAVGTDGIPLALARPDTRVIEGTLIVNDPDGRPLPAQSGSFSLVAWTGGRGWHHPVRIQSGAWQVVVTNASSVDAVSIENFECDNQVVTLSEPRERAPWPASNTLALRARAAHPSILTVVEAGSRVPLSGVTLVRDGEHSFTNVVHPGNPFGGDELGHDLASPIDIDALLVLVSRDRPLPVLVGAPGFAWKRVEIDLWTGGAREIALERGGELIVTAHGPVPNDAAELRLYEADPRLLVSAMPLVVGRAASFAGLAPGEYTLRAELGEWFSRPLVLAEARARIEVGVSSELVLALGAEPQIASAEVRGRVLVPDAWVTFAEMQLGVTLTRQDAVVPGLGSRQTGFARRAPTRRDGYTTFEWTLGEVPVGWYQLEISRPALSTLVEVRTGRTNEFELVAPAPIQLQVIAVDAATGLDIEDATVAWWLDGPRELHIETTTNSVAHPSGRGRLVEVPAAKITVSIVTDEHVPYEVGLDLGATAAPLAHVARLQRACGVVLSMQSGGADMPFPNRWHGWLDQPPDVGRVVAVRSDRFRFHITVDAPGRYAFEYPQLAGFRTVPTQHVDIPAGRFVEHVVQLERETP